MGHDTPIHTDAAGAWCIEAPLGREIAVGRHFDGNRGYRVTLKFTDSHPWNSLSIAAARQAARTLRVKGAVNADATALAGMIEAEADRCERLNTGWLQIGSPVGGFDSQAHGHA